MQRPFKSKIVGPNPTEPTKENKMTYIFLAVILMFHIFISFRIQAVYSERMRMNHLVFSQKDYVYYLALKHTVEYNRMVLCFWVWPISKMWPRELQELK
jgi:hypothetical protein